MAELDTKDRKILYELDRDCRQSESGIARRVGLSRESVRYRISKMLEKGIIKGFVTYINSVRLDQRWFRIFLKFRNHTPEKEKEMIGWLKEKCCWLFDVEGEWDLAVGILVETTYDYRNIMEEFLERYNRYVEEHDFAILINDWVCSKDILLGSKKRTTPPLLIGYRRYQEQKIERLDETDLKVLLAVLNDARKKTIDIARETGLTEMIVRHRLKKMQERDIIIGYKAVISMNKLGYNLFNISLELVDYTAEQKRELITYLRQHPAVERISEYVPSFGLEATIRVKSLAELYEEIGKIRRRFSGIIREYGFLHYVEELRHVQLPLKYIEEGKI
ncbi:Lrp/AsnC family transcriptional regulator [Nanoarchaeota archaeon]